MPIIFHTRDQVHVFTKGQGFGLFRRLAWRVRSLVRGTNGPAGRAVAISKGVVAYIESFTDAEWAAVLKEQEAHRKSHEAEAAAQAKVQAEAQEKAEKERADAIKLAAEEFIKEYGPKPGNWPTFVKTVRPLKQSR